VLWPDTFTNFFEPAVAIAAVEVLEAAGRHVVVPQQLLCCGRPLYDYGMGPGGRVAARAPWGAAKLDDLPEVQRAALRAVLDL
jgi:Fe-S oxidoreductase